jgi:hypothetical protein
MADDDEAARKARAEDLRQRIADLTSGETKAVQVSVDDSEAESSDATDDTQLANKETPLDVSPREFIQRRMRELNRGKR